MNDRFLRVYHIEPRPAFAQSLRQRLEVYAEKPAPARILQLRPAALGVFALLLVLTSIFAVSPAARAQVQDWVGQVGGILFTVSSNYPGGDGPVTTVPGATMSLEDARTALPFTVDLPSWVPEGYVLEETVSTLRLGDGVERVFIQWHASQQGFGGLELQIQDQSPEESNWAVGMGGAEEVQVNGKPAAVVRGGWDADTKQWGHPEILTLFATHNDQTYIFSARENDISLNTMIRIAESLP